MPCAVHMWRPLPAPGPERSKQEDIGRLIYRNQEVVSRLNCRSKQTVRWNLHRDDAVRLSRLITAAGRLRDWREALRLLEGSASLSIRRNAVLFTSAMQSCVSSQQWPAALATELSMRHAGVKPDSVASNTLLNAGSRFSNWPFALCILEPLCETDGALEDRRLLGLELPEPSFDRTTFNSAITACIDGKTWNVALWMFGSLVKESVKPDHVTFTGAACACAIGGAWTSTLELLSLLPPPMRPRAAGSRLAELTRGISKYWPGEEDDARSAQNLRTLGVHKEFMRLRKERPVMQRHVRDRTSGVLDAALQSCAQASSWEPALQMVRRAERFDITGLSLQRCNSITASCVRNHLWHWGLVLLGHARQSALRPDATSATAAFSHCETEQQWKVTAMIFENFQVGAEGGIEPDLTMLSSAATSMEKGGQWSRSFRLLRLARAARFQHNLVSYTAAVDACGAGGIWKDARGLLAEMRQVAQRPGVITYHSMLDAHAADAWQRGLDAFRLMQGEGVKWTALACDTLVRSCWQCGATDGLPRLLSDVKSKRD